MADLVLDVSPQLSKRLIVAIRTENGVIAKPLCPTLLSCDLAIDDTLELMNQFDAGTTTGTDVLLLY
jgi:hypothetical protein